MKVYDTRSNHRLKGHVHSTRQDVGLIAKCLPLHPDNVPVKVLLLGAFTPLQKKKCLYDETFHQSMVRKLLVFFRDQKNPKYSQYDLSDETLNSSPSLQSIPMNSVHPATLKDESKVATDFHQPKREGGSRYRKSVV